MIILVGASASGKTEAAHALTKKYGIKKAITHTTRPPRKGEKNGVDYFFVAENDFEALKRSGMFVETTTYNSFHYGTTKSQIDDSKVIIVDPNGLKSFLVLGDKSIVAFNLMASEETRIKRMQERGDQGQTIKERIKNDEIDFSEKNVSSTHYKIETDNKTVSQVADEIYELYIKELKKRRIRPNGLINQ